MYIYIYIYILTVQILAQAIGNSLKELSLLVLLLSLLIIIFGWSRYIACIVIGHHWDLGWGGRAVGRAGCK